jgi:DNA-binding transcriptional MerR regulator
MYKDAGGLQMIRIGDFSKLSRVSVKTLRYYDEMGLLKPLYVDRFTGCRFYEYDQLLCLSRILALKDPGFSLDEIGQLLNENLTSEQLRGMLKLRRAEAGQKVREETERLEHVESRLRQIEQEEAMSKYDVVLKQVEPLKIASVRAVVPTPPAQGALWEELGHYLVQARARGSGSCFTLYHDDEFKEHDWELEVCQPVQGDPKEAGRIKIRILPAVETMACTLHYGAFATIGEAYDAIIKWVDVNGYHVCGPAREIYLREARAEPQRGGLNLSQTDPETVTEVQFPVEKLK